MQKMILGKYLNEEILGKELERIFPETIFIKDKAVPDSVNKTRPDYRSEQLKLIVEFDGDPHYRSAHKIKKDTQNDYNYNQMGYKVVRIPYFVQLSTQTIYNLFDKKIEYEQTFPHGFISPTVIMPADFCELGISRFELDLKRFDYIRHDIIESLKTKFAELKDMQLVVPKALGNLLNE